MGSTTAFQCDGPSCAVLSTKKKGTRAPADWPRVAVTLPDGTKVTGSFHDVTCALAWLDEQLDGTVAAIESGRI